METNHSIVAVVDDDPAQRRLPKHFIELSGKKVIEFESGEAIIKEIRKGLSPGCVLLDLLMPGMSGEETLTALQRLDPDLPVIITSGQEDIELAVRIIRQGAYDYLVKPIEEESLEKSVRNALERRRISLELSRLRRQVRISSSFDRMVGRSKSMKAVFRLIEKTLYSDITVLILGDSGTGKELVARAIHQYGQRASKPFVVVNCAAIPKELIESELFGHEKGAFTGAIQRKIGKFELASSGTIFLDEIGELEPPVQAKLLRALQEQEIERVGGTKQINIDVRIVAATKRNLREMVTSGEFREDLFYRINTFTIDLPNLSERREDIPILANHFIDKHRESLGKQNIAGISNRALQILLNHNWPGNIRELENAISRAIVMSEHDKLDVDDFPHEIMSKVPAEVKNINVTSDEAAEELVIQANGLSALIPSFSSPDDIIPMEEIKEQIFRQALEVCDGNTTLAAERLEIGRATAFRLVEKYGVKR